VRKHTCGRHPLGSALRYATDKHRAEFVSIVSGMQRHGDRDQLKTTSVRAEHVFRARRASIVGQGDLLIAASELSRSNVKYMNALNPATTLLSSKPLEAEIDEMQKQAASLVTASSSASVGTCLANGNTVPQEGRPPPMLEIECAQEVVARAGEFCNVRRNCRSPMASTVAATASRPIYRLPPNLPTANSFGPRVAKPAAVGQPRSEGPCMGKRTVPLHSEPASAAQKPVGSPRRFTPRSTYAAAQRHLNTLLVRQARVVDHAGKAVHIADTEFGIHVVHVTEL
jgi:hypothetical protein